MKLWVNGCVRRVVVDDRLPVDARGDLLCSCSNNRGELWVSIVEKAYMKVIEGGARGEYEVEGE